MTESSGRKYATPLAYMRTSTNYCDAADELLRIAKKRKTNLMIGKYTAPIQLLYFHSIELSLKAFLGLNDKKIPRQHDIEEYYEQCRALGLPRDRALDSHNAVAGLTSANKEHRLRYFAPGSYSQPSMRMLKTGARFILRAVSKEFERREVRPEKFGKNTMMIMTWD